VDALLAGAAEGETAAAAVRGVLCRTHAELERRTQRLALALLADDERTAVDLMSPRALKLHASYFDPVAANELHPHNTRKVFRYVRILWSSMTIEYTVCFFISVA